MGKILTIRQETDYRFLNYFVLEAQNKKGNPKEYYVASRARDIEHLKIRTGKNTPDGVTMFGLYGEAHDRVVLVRQYRYPVDAWVYELPSGIIEPGEDPHEAAVREFKEETGLSFEVLPVDPMFEKARFQTVGMTDESCAMIYGYATGTPTSEGEEESEEIEVVLADREMVREVLRSEYVAAGCAYQLAHFLHDADPMAYLS